MVNEGGMLRVVTLNLNGIRSAHRKGFFEWMHRQDADFFCLQELKAQQTELPPEAASPPGYHAYFHPAEKRGYSGVALYTRHAPERVVTGLGWPDFDAEGRFLRVDYADLSVIALYLPSGSSSEERQQAKFDFIDRFLPVLKAMRDEGRDFIICGDWNIAHKPIDLKNWRSNQKNSGFLPEERAWLDKVFDELGWVDAFRVVNQLPDQYTWWSNRGQAWAKNVGWRIDYQVVTPGLADKILRVAIYKDERFSDHAPLTLDYDLSL
jgi:exodeoxyribonuclease-3